MRRPRGVPAAPKPTTMRTRNLATTGRRPPNGHGLPVPTPGNVDDFRALYQRRFGVDLAWDDAADAMTALMQFVYLADAAFPAGALTADGPPAPAPTTEGTPSPTRDEPPSPHPET